jgi:hypothetical protein
MHFNVVYTFCIHEVLPWKDNNLDQLQNDDQKSVKIGVIIKYSNKSYLETILILYLLTDWVGWWQITIWQAYSTTGLCYSHTSTYIVHHWCSVYIENSYIICLWRILWWGSQRWRPWAWVLLLIIMSYTLIFLCFFAVICIMYDLKAEHET